MNRSGSFWFLALPLAILISASSGRAEDSRVPDAQWPKWSPAISTSLPAGHLVPDSRGDYHGVADSAGNLVHTMSKYASRQISGEGVRDVIWVNPGAPSFGTIDALTWVITPGDVMHVYFTVEEKFTDSKWPGIDLYRQVLRHTSKPLDSGSWLAPDIIGTYDFLTAGSHESVISISASVGDDGIPIVYFDQVSNTYTLVPTPPPPHWDVSSSQLILYNQKFGSSVVDMASPSGTIGGLLVPTSHSSHRGDLLRAYYPVGGPNYKVQLYGSSSSTVRTTTNGLYVGPCGLYKAADGTKHSVYVETESGVKKVYYVAGGAGASLLGDGIDGAVQEDRLGNLSRFWLSAPATGLMYHQVQNSGTWAPVTPVSHPSTCVGLKAIGCDTLNRWLVCDGYTYADTNLKWNWEPNEGSQAAATQIGFGPNAAANLSNGNVSVAIPLFAMAGHGPCSEMTLYYNSFERNEGTCGNGWRHSYSTFLQSAGGVILNFPDGRRVHLGSGSADDQYGVSLDLVAVSGDADGAVWSVETVDGTKYFFWPTGKLRRVEDRDGNKITLAYTGGTKELLETITDTYGRVVTLGYDSKDRVATITTPAESGTKVYYLVYDATKDLLTEVKIRADVRKWMFTYYPSTGTFAPAGTGISSITGVVDLLQTIKTPQLAAETSNPTQDFWIGYSITGADYGKALIAWDPKVDYDDPPDGFADDDRKFVQLTYSNTYDAGVGGYETTYLDRESKTYKVKASYQKSLPLVIEDPANGAGHTTRFTWDSRRNLLTATDPGNKVTTYSYIDGSEGMPSWVHDLVKTVQLPGDTAVTTYEYNSTWRAVSKITPVTGLPADATEYTYTSSPKGKIDTVKLPGDTVVTDYDYDGLGRLTKITDTAGKWRKFDNETGGYGLATKMTVQGIKDTSSPLEVPWIYTYNVMGQMKTSTPPLEGTTTYNYDEDFRLYSTVYPKPGGGTDTVSMVLNANSQPTSVTTPSGTSETVLNPLMRATRFEDALDHPSTVIHSPNGNGLKFTDVNGKSSNGAYDALNRLTTWTKVVNATGSLTLTTTVAFNFSGQMISETVSGTGSNPPPRTTTWEYDSTTALLTKKNLPGGDTYITYHYDTRRRLVSELVYWNAAFLRGTAYVYDEKSRVKQTVQLSSAWTGSGTPPGLVFEVFYDAYGVVTKSKTPLGNETTYFPDDAHRIAKTVDAAGVESGVEFQGTWTRGTKVQIPGSGLGQPVSNHFDASGQLDYTWSEMYGSDDPNRHKFLYDGSGRLTKETGPDGLDVVTAYDANSRVTGTYVKKSSVTTLAYESEYDNLGNLTKKYAPPGVVGGPSWTYLYDEGNRRTTATTPRSTSSTMAYDAVGNLKWLQDEDGNTTDFLYDLRDRLTQTVYKHSGGAVWETINRTYDGAGNLLSIEGIESGYRVEYQYSPASGSDPHTLWLGKVTWKQGGATWKTLEYDYDSDGRRTVTRIKDAGGTLMHTQEFGYDPANKLTLVKNDGATLATFDYNSGLAGTTRTNFLTKTTLGNGNKVYRDYDKKGRLSSVRNETTGSGTAKVDYGYDKRDRRTSAHYLYLGIKVAYTYTDNSWLETESYDFNAGPPVYTNDEATRYGGNESTDSAVVSTVVGGSPTAGTDFTITYAYDLRGNRSSRDYSLGSTLDSTYLYDLEDRLTSESRGSSTIIYAWADRGVLTRKTVDGVSTDYYTDFLGRITRTICAAASLDWLYTYAPTGDRMKKANLVTPFNSEHYLPSDGDTLCDFTTSSGSEVETGVYVSPGVDGRVARIDPTKGGGDPLRTTYFFGDALQSVLQVTNASGVEIRKQFTDAWGNDIAGVGSGSSGNAGDRYGFTGRENDAESGLMHYRARSYDPMVGRFTSRDPVPYSNLYIYVQNNPTNMNDPFGEDALDDAADLITSYENSVTLGFYSKITGWKPNPDSNASKVGDFAGKVVKDPKVLGNAVADKVVSAVATNEHFELPEGSWWDKAVEAAAGAGDSTEPGIDTAGIRARTGTDVKKTRYYWTPFAAGVVFSLLTPDPGDLPKLKKVGNALESAVDASNALKVVKRTEPEALAIGKKAHKAEEVRPGEIPEVTLPSGDRMDRYNPDTFHIREIKPNNPRGIREGKAQLARYKKEADEAVGMEHTTELTLYDVDPHTGEINYK